jgi:predicted membrane protein
MKFKVSNIIWGLAFIIAGIGFAGNVLGFWDFNLFFDGWWTLFIIIPAIVSIVQDGPRMSNLIFAGVGVVLFLSAQNIVHSDVIARLTIPVILVIIGISFIFGRRGFPHKTMEAHKNFEQNGKVPDYSAIFGGSQGNYRNEVFTGATVNAVFGGVELDLRDAIITEDVVIGGTAIFGGIEIWAPANVRIKVSSIPVFGGVSNKALPPIGEPAATIYIEATCMFGGIEIK